MSSVDETEPVKTWQLKAAQSPFHSHQSNIYSMGDKCLVAQGWPLAQLTTSDFIRKTLYQ